jgi:hypothetical protein
MRLIGLGILCLVASVALGMCHVATAEIPAVSHAKAVSGPWTADFSYVKKDAFTYTDLHITLLKSGRLVLDEPITSNVADGGSLQPGGFGRTKSLSFRDLDGDGTPELLLSLFTGGAHCCFIQQVFDLRTAPPQKTEISFEDDGATVKLINGKVVFVSADDSFAYEFTDYADSGAPIEIWRYTPGRFVDVTSAFPTLIALDAVRWWSYYRQPAKRNDDDVRGILAAWAADEALLGKATQAKQTLLQFAFNGVLDHGIGGWKGSTYVRHLWLFLAKEHYLG